MKLKSLIAPRPLVSILVVAGICLLQPRTATVAANSPTPAAPYIAAVRQFADQALAQARDVYGKPTPLFVDGLNVETLEPVKWKWADGKEWVLCNLANQQGLLRTLDGLSRLTGDPRYKDAALEALRYAFDHLGEQGKDFKRQAVEELTAWGKAAYRAQDNAFILMRTDGTSMEGYVCKKDGYFGPKGRVLKAGHPGADHLCRHPRKDAVR